jgi:hypothetical protein
LAARRVAQFGEASLAQTMGTVNMLEWKPWQTDVAKIFNDFFEKENAEKLRLAAEREKQKRTGQK